MRKYIQLGIADPCHENWENMTPSEKGRFCAACQKQVVDFTRMSDTQLAAFFRKKTTGSVCGRFMEDQLNREIEIPKKRISWVKYFFQFFLPAFLISCKESIRGKVKITESLVETINQYESYTTGIILADSDADTVSGPFSAMDTLAPVIEEASSAMKGNAAISIRVDETPLIEDYMLLKGIVVNEDNQPVPMATVSINCFLAPIVTDSAGVFSFLFKHDRDIQSVNMEVSSVGYKSKKVNWPGDSSFLLTIQLDRDVRDIDTVLMIGDGLGSLDIFVGSVSRKVVTTLPDTAVSTKPQSSSVVRLFPNPVRPGTVLNVECNKTGHGKYTVQLVNLAGQLIFSKEIWLADETGVLPFPVPLVAAGGYIIRLINKETDKVFSQKLIVQY